MLMTNKLTLPVESRMQGDLHVRFGGRLWETYHRKVVRRPSPSLHFIFSKGILLYIHILLIYCNINISFQMLHVLGNSIKVITFRLQIIIKLIQL